LKVLPDVELPDAFELNELSPKRLELLALVSVGDLARKMEDLDRKRRLVVLAEDAEQREDARSRILGDDR
jgi:hypothetical protein